MDRELRVTKGGVILAELKYSYDSATQAKVRIIINRIFDLGDDIKSVYPMYNYESYAYHDKPLTIEEMKAYDIDLLKQQSDFLEHINDVLEYLYQPMAYRYMITQGHNEPVGIAEFDTDFNANKKEMKFISARRMSEDRNISSDSSEPNKVVIDRMCEDYLGCYDTDIVRAG